MAKRKTTEEFIRDAKRAHGDRYDYSETKYRNNYTKLKIICPEHGSFYQISTNHLKGAGCPKCAGNARVTTEEFVKKAREKHGNKYDYSETEYKAAMGKVKIICPKHGEFWQIASCHINKGNGCPKCANERCSELRLKSQQDFLADAFMVHGDRYDYSQTEYENSKTKIKIICPEHGPFLQTPEHHLIGKGCPKCAGNARGTTEEFVKKAIKIHGDKYDYSKTEYKSTHRNVIIICPEHGEFLQSPHNHLKGKGCKQCAGCIKKTTKEFVEQARRVHGDKYDYSQAEYRDGKTKLKIICPEHGEFFQTPTNHLYGKGCSKCAGIESPQEIKVYEKLLEVFPESDIEKQYNKDKRYPFKCDFYIRPLDLFIELNLHGTHGGHWFDPENPADTKRLETMKAKAEKSKFYEKEIEVWTERDVRKRETAERNGINYKVFWNNDLSDFYQWFSEFFSKTP